MNHFPIFLRLQDQRVLIVGGGEVAARKLRLLRAAGAQVEIVARKLNEEIAGMHASGAIRHVGERFEPAQLQGCRLAVAATDDAALNHEVSRAAQALGIPVNVVDDPAASTYITPSIVQRDPVTIAISTDGAAPVLARRLRERLEALLPSAYGRLGAFMGRQRAQVKALPVEARRKLWEDFLDGPGPERLFIGDEAAAASELDSLLRGRPPRGEVYLVGAGPGDPDLLTFRALRLMQQADVVLYDRLVSPAILELVRRDAERLFVGKRRNQHTVPQDEINAELVRLAQAGKRVLRLKGGDPFIFGRGGEEIEQLAAAGIAFQVVPGVTAASGCSAYAGIPLTHRDYAQACIFVTGHARADGTLKLHWDQLARAGQTVVIYMGLATLPELCRQFIAHGLPVDWPAAVVEHGASAQQRVIAATLGDLPARVAEAAFSGPTLVIVGEVVKLRERLQWFGADARR